MSGSKHSVGKAFGVKVSDAIRHHVGEAKAIRSKRVIAHDDRDAAIAELTECGDRTSKEATVAKALHSDAIMEIERLSVLLKWHSNQIDELVQRADEPALDFMYDPPASAPSSPQKTLEHRPVGRPGPVRPDLPDPSKGDGVDEHLSASPNELDMREQLKCKVISAGCKTIGAIAAIIDDLARDICAELNLTDKEATAVTVSVTKFRKAHRSAMREADREII